MRCDGSAHYELFDIVELCVFEHVVCDACLFVAGRDS